MSDWQVGDLAVCVDDSPSMWAGHNGGLVEGNIYTVREIVETMFGDIGFRLHELPDPVDALDRGFRSERFRKIRPDEREACEPEFVTLLKRSRSPARVE